MSFRPFEIVARRWVQRWTPAAFPGVDAGVIGRPVDAGRSVAGDPPPTAGLDQVHGATVARVAAAGRTPCADGAVTAETGLRLRIRVADCVPVFLAAPGGIGVAHAGWRGTEAGIARAAVEALRAVSGDAPATFSAFVGPAIDRCCYEVGPEVAARFAPAFLAHGGRHLDLKAASRSQLLAAGIAPDAIEVSPICTRCHQHLLHSWRGSRGGPGRIEAVIMRRAADDHRDRVFS